MSHRFTALRVILTLLLVVAFSLAGSRAGIQRSSRFSIMGRLTADTASAVAGLPIRPSDAFVYQGYLTDAGGTPLTGTYSITFRLYRASLVISPPSTYYTLVDTKVVAGIQVTKGLFTASITGLGSYFTGEYQLYLGIQVGSDPEMMPYQEIASAPTALGLHPGTVILNTANDEPGLEVHSLGESTTGAAVIAASDRYTAAGGTGLYAESQGTSATIVTKNNGNGLLLEGYGSDGGGDEFRITNNGTIQTKQDSYIFVPAATMVKDRSADATHWSAHQGGTMVIFGGVAGARGVSFPVTLPTVLYGQSVEAKSITVYYKTTNGSKAAIWDTYLHKSTAAFSYRTLISDATHRTSTTDTSYTLPVTANGVLSSNEGLAVNMWLYFANDTDYLAISGIRIQLGHHPDY